VFGLDGNTAKLTRLVAGEKQHPPGSFCVSFEHPGTRVKHHSRSDYDDR